MSRETSVGARVFGRAGPRTRPSNDALVDVLVRAGLLADVPSPMMSAALRDIEPDDRCAAAKLLAALPEYRRRVALFEPSVSPSVSIVEALDDAVRAEFMTLTVGEVTDDEVGVTAKVFRSPVGEHRYRDLRGLIGWINDMLRRGKRPAQLGYLPRTSGVCAVAIDSSTSSALRKAGIRITHELPEP